MDKWKDKEAFLQWAKSERSKAENRQHLYFKYINNSEKCPPRIKLILKNSTLNLKTFETVLDNEILEHLNYYFSDLDIDIYHLDVFISTIDSVRFFKNSKLSTDAKEFNREIIQLKKKADNLQYFSMTPIDIRIPILPQDAIYSMIIEFRKYELENYIIEYFHNFFKDRKRLPKKTKTFLQRIDKLRRIEKVEKNTKIDFAQIRAAEKINWYKPNRNLRYDYLNPLRVVRELIIYEKDNIFYLGSCEIDEQIDWLDTSRNTTYDASNPFKIIKKVSLVVKESSTIKKL